MNVYVDITIIKIHLDISDLAYEYIFFNFFTNSTLATCTSPSSTAKPISRTKY